MAYKDRKRVRANSTKIRLDDYVDKQIEKIIERDGGQRAVILRELVIKGLELHEQEVKRKDE